MISRELSTAQGAIAYRLYEDHVEITGYRGKDIRLEVPEYVEEKPVTVVLKKAFLSAKTLREVKLPYSVCRIDDFAFAFCSNLKSIYLSERLTMMGNSIFKECELLQEIHVLEASSTGIPNEEAYISNGKREVDYSFLLAAAPGILEAPYLFRPDQVYQKDWIDLWDKRMINILQIEDMEGYSKLLLCGEEDYGTDETNPEVYRSNRIKAKVRLCMLRLLHDYALSEEDRNYLVDYLQAHKKGADSEETWLVVLMEHGDEREYYELLTGIGCVDQNNIADMLTDMKDMHAEMKAYLLKYKEGQKQEVSFFDMLNL